MNVHVTLLEATIVVVGSGNVVVDVVFVGFNAFSCCSICYC